MRGWRNYVLFLSAITCTISNSSAWAAWVKDGICVSAAIDYQTYPEIIADGNGGAIITWRDNRMGSGYDIYAQRVMANGEFLWTIGGIAICSAPGDQLSQQLISDMVGGAIIAWEDKRTGQWDIYAQRVDANGNKLWTTDGLAICTATDNQRYPKLVPDGVGGAIITWMDSREGVYGHEKIYAQRINANGDALWWAGGTAVCSGAWEQEYPTLASDWNGGAIIAWQDIRTSTRQIFAQRLNANGNLLWVPTGVAICASTLGNYSLQIMADGFGGAIIAWYDYPTGSYQIYAQRVDADGNVLWKANGIKISNRTYHQYEPRLLGDGTGGAIIAWFGSGVGTNENDILAQRISSEGNIVWAADGIAVCSAAGQQRMPELCSDGTGGAIIVWGDLFRDGTNIAIYAQRITANGSVVWVTDGVAICTAGKGPEYPKLAPDGAGGAIITWHDWRNGDEDVWAQRLHHNGYTGVPTLLQDYGASYSEAGISLSWRLSEVDIDVEFFIGRSTAFDGPFRELPPSEIRKDGLSFSFVDDDWEPGTTYWYRVGYRNAGGWNVLFDTGPIATPPASLALYQNVPNPFNPTTTISFTLPERTRVALAICDVQGRLVRTLADEMVGEGYQERTWDGKDASGSQVGSGVYFYRLTAGDKTLTKKMVFLK